LEVIGLVRDHLADENDGLVERLAGRADVLRTHGQVIDVGVEDRSQHDASRPLFGVVRPQRNPRAMQSAGFDVTFFLYQALEVVLDHVGVGRIAERLQDLDARVVGEQPGEPLVFSLQSAKSDAHGALRTN
jgi:hypothetical protein